MTDQLPRDLTSLFESTATRADLPPLPLTEVLAEGRALQRARRRRAALWSATAVAAAVLAVVVPLAATGNHTDDRPAPAHHRNAPPPDEGVPTTPTTLPYLVRQDLHLGGKVITLPGQVNNFVSHGDTTIVFDLKSSRWWRLRNGKVEPYGPAYHPASGTPDPWRWSFGPTVSPDGRTIAVQTHPTRSTTRITDYDAATDDELGHVDLDEPAPTWPGSGDSVTVSGVNDDGTVYWLGEAPQWWSWKPGEAAAHRLDVALDPAGSDYPPEGAVTDDNRTVPLDGRVVTFADDGTVRPMSGLPDGFDPTRAVWSPSGAIVAAHVAGQAAIVDLDGGSAPVRPPTDVTILQWFGFESDAYVVAAAAVDNVPSLVRCATDRSACAVISRLPADWQSWRWATSPPGGTGQP